MAPKSAKAAPQRRPSGTRIAKQAQLRQQLVEEALKQFLARGFDQVTVDDIVSTIDVSRRSFFRYFQSKDDLVFSWLDDMGDIIRPVLCKRLLTRDPLSALSDAFRQLARHLDADPEGPVFLTKLIFSTPSLGGRYIYEAMRWEGEFVQIAEAINPSTPETRFARKAQSALAVAAWIAALREWAACDHSSPLVGFVEVAFETLLKGATTAKPLTPTKRTSRKLSGGASA